ncbi:MAG TPA: thermonuclease family protein [Dongiaceae bacterium]
MLLLSRLAFGADHAGVATAKNGDSVLVAGVDVRLFGIDAPEWQQQCILDGRLYACGQAAHVALARRVNGKVLRCEQLDYDQRNQRPVARCFVGDLDVGGWMVAQGLAVAYRRYSDMYADAEAQAKAARLGVWQGDFVTPEQWRQGTRLAAESTGSPTVLLRDTGSGECSIKGNISQRGERIYHMPGQLNYADTRIDPARGERWFCTETEARAAGWRKARQ